jgi:hypothetical protein
VLLTKSCHLDAPLFAPRPTIHTLESGFNIMATGHRRTFAELVEQARVPCARRHFERAMAAGLLRRQARDDGDNQSRRRFAAMKDEGIRKALELAPEKVRVKQATDNPSLMSVLFSGLVSLHCPPDALVGEAASER